MRPGLDSSFHFNPLAVGVGPIVNLPIFAIMVLMAGLVARMLRPQKLFEAIVFVVSGLACYEVILVTQQLYPAALACLAAGMSSIVTQLVSRFPSQSLRLVRVTTATMAAAAIAGTAWLASGPRRAEANALATVAPAPPDAPNVVFLILDTVRAMGLGMYGNPRNTSPSLDSLARNGIRFERAWSTAPWTLPSHATMLTGRYGHELSTDWSSPYDGKFPLLSERLRDRGYATAAFVGNLTYLSRRWGLDDGFMRYEDYQVDPTVLWTTSNLGTRVLKLVNSPSRHRVLTNGTSARLIRERFGAWQRSIGDRPFFAFINLFDAHAPYGAPAPYDTMFIGRRPRFYDIDNWQQRDSTEFEELRTGYEQAIAWLDSQVGAIIADLRDRGMLDRTLIIVTSDHGEEFGEHGYSGHGASLHATQLRVPLLIVPPGWRGSMQVGDDVSLRDLAATVADVAGLGEESMPGNSLTRYWRPSDIAAGEASPILSEVTGRPKIRPWYPSSRGSLRSIVEGRMSDVKQVGGPEWLFDLARDPLELHDLSGSPEYANSLKSLREALSMARGGDQTGSRSVLPLEPARLLPATPR